MTNSVIAPYPVFFGNNGQPLASGYIYLGKPNQNAQAYPVQAYWDEALTIPATQPIRTVLGRPSRNGSPSKIYVADDYSIIVQDKTGKQIYSAPTSALRFDDAIIAGGSIAARSPVTARVPTTYTTAQDAFDTEGDYATAPDGAVTVYIESGYQPASETIISGGDYSAFTYGSEGATITVDASFPAGHDFLSLDKATSFTFDALVDMTGLGNNGILAENGSSVVIKGGAGVKNAGANGGNPNGAGILAISSHVTVDYDASGPLGVIVDGAARRGVWATVGGSFAGKFGSYKNIGTDPAISEGEAGAFVSRLGSFYDDNCDFSGSVRAIRNGGGFAQARDADFTNIDGTALWGFLGAQIQTEQADFSGSGWRGDWSVYGSNFDSKLNISAQETNSTDLIFNGNGTVLLVVGANGDDVSQYTLSEAYDLTTASFDGSFDVSGKEASPAGMDFRGDGQRMFIVGPSSDQVHQYNLGTGWDVTGTVTFIQSFDVSAQSTSPQSIRFNGDGTKMFILDQGFQRIFAYTLGTGWDISTASYDSVFFDVSGQDTTPKSFDFSDDGRRMYLAGQANDRLYQYDLTTAFDLTTATYAKYDALRSEGNGGGIDAGSVQAIRFAENNQYYLLAESANVDHVYKYTTWNYSVIYVGGPQASQPQGGANIVAERCTFDGAKETIVEIDTSTGTVNIDDGTGTGILGPVATVTGGMASIQRGNFSVAATGHAEHGLLASDQAEIEATGFTFDGGGVALYAVRAIQGSKINVRGGNLSNVATAIFDVGDFGEGEIHVQDMTINGNAGLFPNGAILKPGAVFATRAEAVTAITYGWRLPNGKGFTAAGLRYTFDDTATDISDMLGVVPAGVATPPHFGVTGTGTETAGMQEWVAYVNGRYGRIPRDMHIKIDAGLLIDTSNTYVEVQGILEQVTWGLEAFLVENVNGVTINGQGTGKIISTQTKTNLSTSLANRWRGELARVRSSAVVWDNATNSTVTGLRIEGFVNGVIDMGGQRIYRTDYDSTGSTTTTMVLHPDDQEADDFYNGWIIRPLNVTDASIRRVTDYDGTTNTVTVDTAWSAAPSETDAYYSMIKEPSVGNRFFDCTGDNIDFYSLNLWAKNSSVYDITCDHIESTQAGSSAPPHLIYYSGDSVYLRHSNVHLNSWTCYQCDTGSVVKVRGCDGLHLGNGYCDKSRAIADVEYSTDWTMGKLNGRRLGFGLNARPYGLTIAGGEGPKGGSVLAHFDPDYDGGGTGSPTLRPFGVWCQGLGSDNPLGDLTQGFIDSIHVEWAGSAQSCFGLLAQDESSGGDGQISGIRVGFIYTDVPNAVSTTARVVNGDGIIFDKVMSPNTDLAIQFDASATNCRAKIDPDTSGSITDNGTDNIIKKGDILSTWAAPTGTADRTTFATSTVTLEELAQRVKALVDDLQS